MEVYPNRNDRRPHISRRAYLRRKGRVACISPSYDELLRDPNSTTCGYRQIEQTTQYIVFTDVYITEINKSHKSDTRLVEEGEKRIPTTKPNNGLE